MTLAIITVSIAAILTAINICSIRTARSEAKFRLTVVLAGSENKNKIDWLQKVSGSKNASELLSAALSTYHKMVEEYAAGGKIIIQKINGDEIEFIPFTKNSPKEEAISNDSDD